MITKKKVDQATIEEILGDLCHYEDMDSALIISSTENGGAFVMEFDGRMSFSRSTLKEALVAFGKATRDRYEFLAFDEYDLDWS